MRWEIKAGKDDSICVSSVALGCWAFSDEKMWGRQDLDESISTLHAAIDQGINFFDTAPGYGDGASEKLVGEAMQDRRDKVVIASKVARWDLRPIDLRQSCEASLRRLRTDYIDLFQLHWPSHEIPLDETLTVLEALRQEGKCRAIGVCNFGRLDLHDWLRLGGAHTTNQVAYSLLARAIEMEVVPIMKEAEMRVLAYCPLMQGLLSGKFDDADAVPDPRARSRHFRSDRPFSLHGEEGFEKLTFDTIRRLKALAGEWGLELAPVSLAWLLQQPAVGSLIVGVRSRAQLERNLVATQIRLSPAQIGELSAITEDLKMAMGPEPDLWASPSRMR